MECRLGMLKGRSPPAKMPPKDRPVLTRRRPTRSAARARKAARRLTARQRMER